VKLAVEVPAAAAQRAPAPAPDPRSSQDRDPAEVRAERIIYIMGYGRSGSTVLDVLLGSAAPIEGVGELDLLHRDWNDRSCSCGSSYGDCFFWSRVRASIHRRIGSRTEAEMEGVLRRVESLAALPALALGILPRAWREAYESQVRAELDGIASVRGRSWILDSSKSAREAAGRALALERIVRIPVKRIHLVRDGRAVLWSVKRGDNVRLGAGKSGEAASFSFASLRAVVGWVLANSIALLDQTLAPKGATLRVRYEDLVTRPDEVLARIGGFLELDLSEVTRRVAAAAPFEVGHSTGGNRMRQGGKVVLRADHEWEARLGRRDRFLFWSLAWPLALWFGYGRSTARS
jgi:hypothetical protein